MDHVSTMGVEERRRQQREVGLVLQEALTPTSREEVPSMHTNTTPRTPAKHGAPTTDPAIAAVENIARSLEMTPTFREIALHELKRAAVYVPLLLGSGLTLLWARRRFFG
jgi:hypothetical protein